MSRTVKAWHRRHAVQLAAQLPEDPEDARCVLKCTEHLLETFLCSSAKPKETVRAPSLVPRLVRDRDR